MRAGGVAGAKYSSIIKNQTHSEYHLSKKVFSTFFLFQIIKSKIHPGITISSFFHIRNIPEFYLAGELASP